ncbi:helix-turn-helix domain-containing protein [Streptomyces sp. NPDC050421]|uniref:helix-turn-helix domain-containing protein n=1 Tax=Streptomyces sp. NPDC050421 TaxID=3365613 RepID=UPI0037BC7D47
MLNPLEDEMAGVGDAPEECTSVRRSSTLKRVSRPVLSILMRDSREPTPSNAKPDGQGADAGEGAELLAAQLRAARRDAGLPQQQLAEEMRVRGFSWRQTTVAKSESAARPVLFTEVVALSEVLGKPIDFFLKPPDTLEIVVEAAAKKLNSAQMKFREAEASLAFARYELEREECAGRVALAAKGYRDSYDSGVLRHELDAICARYGKRLIDFNDAYKAVPVTRLELENIDKEALVGIAEAVLHGASMLSDEEIAEDGAEILNGASDYLKSGETDPRLLEEFRTAERWGDLVCSRLVDLFVDRISQ